MKTDSGIPDTLQAVVKYFADEGRAFEYMKGVRWPDGNVTCPRCNASRVSFITTRKKWTCLECKRQFSIKVGTIFEDSPIGFDKWICATWLIANAKNGISSYEIGRSLGVCQKTGWFMLQRIRLAMHNGTVEKMTGRVEVDETFIGGKARNMHAKVKRERKIKSGGESMTPVMGLLERATRKECSKVRTKVLKGRGGPELKGEVRKYVLKGEEVISDYHRGYWGLHRDYTHSVIDHAVAYVDGHIHTNGLENFWSLLKRAIKGTYVAVEPFHLFRYLDEQAFRFNERKDKDGDKGRFQKAIAGIVGRRLTWNALTGGDDELPAPAQA